MVGLLQTLVSSFYMLIIQQLPLYLSPLLLWYYVVVANERDTISNNNPTPSREYDRFGLHLSVNPSDKGQVRAKLCGGCLEVW